MQAAFDPFGTADLDSLDEEFPDGLAAPEVEIPDAGVERIIRLVDATGLSDQIEAWEAHEQVALGGRPKPYPARTWIVGLLLAALVHNRALDTAVVEVLHRQISGRMREKLGIRTGAAGRHETLPDYYRRLNRRMNTSIETFDPSPWVKNRLMLLTDAEKLKKPLTDEEIAERRDRLDLVVHLILHASFMAMPRRIRRLWKGDLAVDGTPIRQFTRGVRRGSPWASADLDSAWYVREGDGPDDHASAEDRLPNAKVGKGRKRKADSKGRKRNHKEAFYGQEATLAVMVGRYLGGRSYHPNLVVAMVLDKPGFRIGENGTRVVRQTARRHGVTGWLGADRAYSNSMPEKYQIPARALGYRHVYDYREDQLGVQDTFAGAIQVDGGWYCPSMPEPLINATKKYRAKEIDKVSWEARIAERQRYELWTKDRYSDGRTRLSSPAERANPAVVCGRKPESSKSTRLDKTPIKLVDATKPAICAQATVTFPVGAGAKFAQELRHGSPEWQARYALMRNTNEGFNGTAKDGAYAGLGQATRRRKRGVAAQSLLCAVLLFAENMRRIDAFLKQAAEDDAGELHTVRKPRARGRRAAEVSVNGQGDAAESEAPPPLE